MKPRPFSTTHTAINILIKHLSKHWQKNGEALHVRMRTSLMPEITELLTTVKLETLALLNFDES